MAARSILGTLAYLSLKILGDSLTSTMKNEHLLLEGFFWEALYGNKEFLKKDVKKGFRGSELLTKSPKKLPLTSFLRKVTEVSL